LGVEVEVNVVPGHEGGILRSGPAACGTPRNQALDLRGGAAPPQVRAEGAAALAFGRFSSGCSSWTSKARR